MTQKIGIHFAFAAGAALLGASGAMGVRKISNLKAPFSGSLTTSLVGGTVSLLSQKMIERSHAGERLKARFGEGVQYEEVSFMAATFFGTALLTYTIGPKIAGRKIHFVEATSYSVLSTVTAILAFLFSSQIALDD